MSTLQITQVGYNKVVDANEKGYKLKITKVKFGDGTNYVPSASDTKLHGNILWEGPIANCDVITDEILDYLCICPESLGKSTIFIGEIGLYIENQDGTFDLFAIGCYPYPFGKAPDARFKTHALVLSPYLSSAIDLTLTWTMSLPRVNHYGQLPNPERTGDNAYIVNNGFTANGYPRPSMLTRYAITDTGPMAWGLLNGNLYYKGPVIAQSSSSFKLVNQAVTNVPPEVIDFAFAYVYEGTGRSQCRAVAFNPVTQSFETLYEDFSLIIATSVSPGTSTACDTPTGATNTSVKVTNLDNTSQVIIWTAVRLDEGAGLIYQARWDASVGYPQNPLRGQFWVISVAGILNGVCYQVGDWLVYNGTGIWDKVDNTELPYLLCRGDWDASTGQAPPAHPVQYYWENLRQGHYWIITTRGTIADIDFTPGDWIVWTGTAWDRRNNMVGINYDAGHLGGLNADMVDSHHTSDTTVVNSQGVAAPGIIALNNGVLQPNLNSDMIHGYRTTDVVDTGGNRVRDGIISLANALLQVSLNADMLDGIHWSDIEAMITPHGKKRWDVPDSNTRNTDPSRNDLAHVTFTADVDPRVNKGLIVPRNTYTIFVSMVGGGGGVDFVHNAKPGGGGGGAWFYMVPVPVQPGWLIDVEVGYAGFGGPSFAEYKGCSGGNSKVIIRDPVTGDTIETLFAGGGGPGQSSAGTSPGGIAGVFSGRGGNSGSYGGRDNGLGAADPYAGNGAGSIFGPLTSGGNGAATTAVELQATGYGCGGAGNPKQDATEPGANGSPGLVLLEW
jgi:hypothetical protein